MVGTALNANASYSSIEDISTWSKVTKGLKGLNTVTPMGMQLVNVRVAYSYCCFVCFILAQLVGIVIGPGRGFFLAWRGSRLAFFLFLRRPTCGSNSFSFFLLLALRWLLLPSYERYRFGRAVLSILLYFTREL